MGKTLKTEIELKESTVVIIMEGVLDIYSCQEFKQALAEKVNLSNVLHVVINLSALTYIDSTGLGVLIGLQKRCREIQPHVRLVLIITNKNITKIFRTCGLNKLFDIFENIGKAEESLCENCDLNTEIQKGTGMALSNM